MISSPIIFFSAVLAAALLVGPSTASRSLLTLDREAFVSVTRRLLEKNPDFGAQRGATPTWMTGGSSSSNSQPQSSSFQGTDAGAAQASLEDTSSVGNTDAGNGNNAASAPSSYLFSGGQYGSGWSDSSYSVRPFTDFTPAGKSRGSAKCAYLPKGAATSFHGWQGSFSGHGAFEFWAYAGSTSVPDIDVVLVSSSGRECNHVPLSSLSVTGNSNGWNKFWIQLAGLGCDLGQVVKVDLRNVHPEYVALLCIDEVRLP